MPREEDAIKRNDVERGFIIQVGNHFVREYRERLEELSFTLVEGRDNAKVFWYDASCGIVEFKKYETRMKELAERMGGSLILYTESTVIKQTFLYVE